MTRTSPKMVSSNVAPCLHNRYNLLAICAGKPHLPEDGDTAVFDDQMRAFLENVWPKACAEPVQRTRGLASLPLYVVREEVQMTQANV